MLSLLKFNEVTGFMLLAPYFTKKSSMNNLICTRCSRASTEGPKQRLESNHRSMMSLVGYSAPHATSIMRSTSSILIEYHWKITTRVIISNLIPSVTITINAQTCSRTLIYVTSTKFNSIT